MAAMSAGPAPLKGSTPKVDYRRLKIEPPRIASVAVSVVLTTVTVDSSYCGKGKPKVFCGFYWVLLLFV